jgi:hypothetical protein
MMKGNETRRMCKDAVVNPFKVLCENCYEDTEEHHESFRQCKMRRTENRSALMQSEINSFI